MPAVPFAKGAWCHQVPPTAVLLLSRLLVARLQQGHGLGGAQPLACLSKPPTRQLDPGRWPTVGAPAPQGQTLLWGHSQCWSIPNLGASQLGTSSSWEHPHPRNILLAGASSSQDYPHPGTIPTPGPSSPPDHPHPGTIPTVGSSPPRDHPHPRSILIPGPSHIPPRSHL